MFYVILLFIHTSFILWYLMTSFTPAIKIFNLYILLVFSKDFFFLNYDNLSSILYYCGLGMNACIFLEG